MLKRFVVYAASVIVFAMLPFIALEANAAGATSTGYLPISPPQPTSGDKVEVVEVFSYGCIHCAHFQPLVDEWVKHIDRSVVQFTYLPATFNASFSLFARGYFAASSLGAVEATHQKVFNEIFEANRQIRNFDDLSNLYASLGVDRAAFMKAAQSFLIESQLRRAGELSEAYGVDGTPSIIVAGKYRVTGESAGGNDRVFVVVDQLIAKEKAGLKKPTARK